MSCLRKRTLAIALSAVAVLFFNVAAIPTQDDYPTDPQEAMSFYEGNVDEWNEGPVSWILLETESELWDELETAEEKQSFIDWFWERRDPDLRDDGNPVRDEFYAKVAHANDRFDSDFPYGWKSDRGRVFLVLGEPQGVQATNFGTEYEGLRWTYLTVGPRALEAPVDDSLGEFDVFFVLTDGTNYEIASDTGIRGTLPRTVRDAFEVSKEAHIVNPDLQLDVISVTDSMES